MSEPAAEYMSKIGSEEGKNEGGSQLGALAFPNPLRASTRSQRNDVGSGGQNGGNVDRSAGGENPGVIFAGPETAQDGGRPPPPRPRPVAQGTADTSPWVPNPRRNGDLRNVLRGVPSGRHS